MGTKLPPTYLPRRNFIRLGLIGGGIVSQFHGIDKWIKPMVDVVILPTHAMTSPVDPPTPPTPPPTPPPPTVPPPRGSQIFLSSGSFTVPAGVTLIEISATGGAGGGGAGGNAGRNDTGGNGGNGSAGLTQRQPFRVSPGDTLIITIGAGGVGGFPYTSTRRANGGGAGEAGLDTIITGGAINLNAQGGRGGGGGGGVIGGATGANPTGAWPGNPGQDGSASGLGGSGLNRTTPDGSRDGGNANGGVTGPAGGGAGGLGAQANGSNFSAGSAGSIGTGGQLTISW